MPGLTSTATTSSSYRPAARLMTSTCPLVTGSNEPGQTARLTGSDRTGAGPRRTAGRADRSGVSATPTAPRGWTARRRATAPGASQPPLGQRPEHAAGPPRRASRRAGRRAPGRTGSGGGPATTVGHRAGDDPAARQADGGQVGPEHRAARRGPDSTKTHGGRARATAPRARARRSPRTGRGRRRRRGRAACRGELNRRLAGAVAGGPDARRAGTLSRRRRPTPRDRGGSGGLMPSPATRRARRWPARRPRRPGPGWSARPRSVSSSAVGLGPRGRR